MSTLAKIFWLALVVKLGLAAALPLTNDESYYWVWSQHLQLSYYDHPPFVAWLYWLGDFVNFLPGSVRWPGVLLGHATLGVWLKLLKPYLDERQRTYWLWMALLSPLLGGSALVVTPDVPLMFFYGLSLWLFFRWLANPKWKISLAFGAAMGLGFSSKYMMVLFGLSLLPLLLLSLEVRQAFRRSWPLLAAGILAGTFPVWLWNFLHDFSSLKFQAHHGLGRKFWKPSWTYEYILVQIGVIFPVVLYWAARAGQRMPKVFHLLAWTPLAFFLCTTYRGYVEANWPLAAYPSIFALAVSCLPDGRRSLRATIVFWGVVMGGLAVIVLAQPEWARTTKFREFHQFDPIIEASKTYSPLYARSYQMASKMTFEMRRNGEERAVYKLRGMNRRDFYDFLEQSDPQERLYYVAAEKGDQLPLAYINKGHKITATTPVNERFEIWTVEAP